jgi:release factor glutamine methyltransferase
VTIRAALLQGQRLLEEAGIDAPRLTAEVLLAHAVGCERAWLFAHSTDELVELWWIHCGRHLHQRLQGKPTQYITGLQEFYGREFRVAPDVLIPRPETEHVIEAALEKWREPCVDIGAGSGAIAVTLALERSVAVTATDLSLPALAVAAENARRLGARVDLVACDLAAPFGNASFGLVVSNPPYVALRDKATLPREVREHEPEIALYAGDDGLDVCRRLIPEAARILKPGGWLILEIGATQAEPVRALLHAWSDVEVRPDLAGLPRVVLAKGGRL